MAKKEFKIEFTNGDSQHFINNEPVSAFRYEKEINQEYEDNFNEWQEKNF